MSDGYEKSSSGSHEIISDNILVCSRTGRVIAVFYNDYDLDNVLTDLGLAKTAKEEAKDDDDIIIIGGW